MDARCRTCLLTEPSHPTQIYEALIYLIVFGVCMYMYWKTNAKNRKGLITGVGLTIIFVARFLIEYIKNVQVDFEIRLRESTGLILGQWLSIPFIIWGIWLIVSALKNKPEPANIPKASVINQGKDKSKTKHTKKRK